MLSAEELHILSFYRASELAGSMLLGKLALHTNHDHLRVPLTEQCLEEAKHAWMLTQTIDKLGIHLVGYDHAGEEERAAARQQSHVDGDSDETDRDLEELSRREVDPRLESVGRGPDRGDNDAE